MSLFDESIPSIQPHESTQLDLFQQTAMPPEGPAHSRGVTLARHRAILVVAMRERMAQYDALSDALGKVGTQLSALQREGLDRGQCDGAV